MKSKGQELNDLNQGIILSIYFQTDKKNDKMDLSFLPYLLQGLKQTVDLSRLSCVFVLPAGRAERCQKEHKLLTINWFSCDL